jgi:hypothetical protein
VQCASPLTILPASPYATFAVLLLIGALALGNYLLGRSRSKADLDNLRVELSSQHREFQMTGVVLCGPRIATRTNQFPGYVICWSDYVEFGPIAAVQVFGASTVRLRYVDLIGIDLVYASGRARRQGVRFQSKMRPHPVVFLAKDPAPLLQALSVHGLMPPEGNTSMGLWLTGNFDR